MAAEGLERQPEGYLRDSRAMPFTYNVLHRMVSTTPPTPHQLPSSPQGVPRSTPIWTVARDPIHACVRS